jgi:hypothetical protein
VIALLLLASIQTAPAPADEGDIVVIGQRLAKLSVMVGKDPRGRFTCNLSETSGSAQLDAQLCRTASKCVATGAGDATAVSACIDRRKPALLADLRSSLAESTK